MLILAALAGLLSVPVAVLLLEVIAALKAPSWNLSRSKN